MKIPFLISLLSLFFISCEPTMLANVKSVDDAKKRIDWVIQKDIEIYKNLCSQPKNDDVKKKFADLKVTLEEVYFAGEKCINLDYTQQSEVTNYAISKLKSNTSLSKLVNMSEIDCW